MDYTTTTIVKKALGSTETTDDTLLGTYITAVSRFMDHRLAGSQMAVDYFKSETITNEVLRGQVDAHGNLVCYPHKPRVASVSALSYRGSPLEGWTTVSTEIVEVQDGPIVTYWTSGYLLQRIRPQVMISYSGGLATTVDNLPADLIEIATVLTVRFYKEAKSGLGDTIGVAELGTLVYTKALPSRVLEMEKAFRRAVPWM